MIRQSLPGLQATGNWQKVINDPSLNAVVVGTWPYLHKTLVLEALQAGKHVLTEARLVSQGSACIPNMVLGSASSMFMAGMYDRAETPPGCPLDDFHSCAECIL